MSFTINSEKEIAEPRRPVLLFEFTFSDGSVWRAATINCTYGGNAYAAAISEDNIDRLEYLSEQGIDRVPSARVAIADADAVLFGTWERGALKGFRGATLVARLALLDVITGEFSAESLVPFLGICDPPTLDERVLAVTANNALNLTAYQLPPVAISVRCPWINPATTQQRSEAASADSRFFKCGETRDLTTAPPCSQTLQTCTQPTHFGGSTFQVAKQGSGREYISGNKIAFTNPDTSGKTKLYWPQWLGGAAWIDIPVLNQWADGNYTRGEAAVGIGPVDVLKVIVNGIELDQASSGDYRWHYVNNGARVGAHNTDTGYADGDVYGNETVIQFLAPHSVIDPNSLASIRVLGRKHAATASVSVVSATATDSIIRVEFGRLMGTSDPGDGALVTITGSSWSAINGSFILRYLDLPYDHAYLEGTFTTGSGTGGTLYYDSSTLGNGGSVPTTWVIQEALRACGRFSNPDFGTTWGPVAAICEEPISFTDQNGLETSLMRFGSSIALKERRSVADIVRGLRQSIGAFLYIGSTGKLELFLEGPLAEQQPSVPDGSNYTTGISSTKRDGTTATGYAAYLFNESNSWGLKRTGQANSTTPNKVTFPFLDPANDWAVSTFSEVDPEDVSRLEQETAGGLQVQPEGIASYNFAFRCARLGLAKILRGNPSGDTRGTEWWEWQSSFRGCKVKIGQIVAITNSRVGYAVQLVRVTGIKPSRNYETVTFTGHFHADIWYLDTPADLADPSRAFYHFTPPPPDTSGGTGPLVPPSIVTATATSFREAWANSWQDGLQGTILIPDESSTDAIKYILIERLGPDTDTQQKPVLRLDGPFTRAATIDWKGVADIPGDPLDSHDWKVVINAYNADNVPAPTPLELTVTIDPITATGITGTDQNVHVSDQAGGVTTKIRIAFTGLSEDTIGTFWLTRGDGSSGDPGFGFQIQLGSYPVTTGTPYHEWVEQYLPTNAAETAWVAKAVPYYTTAATAPAGALTSSFTVAQAATPSATWASNATIDSTADIFTDRGVRRRLITLSVDLPLSNPDYKAARLIRDAGRVVSGVWTSPHYDETAVTDADPASPGVSYSGNRATIKVGPWETVPDKLADGTDNPDTTVRFYWELESSKNGGTWTRQTSCWSGAGFGDVDMRTDATLSTIPLAPAVVSVTVATVRSTSAGTLGSVNGIDAWNSDLTVRLNVASALYGLTRAIRVTIPGLADKTITSWTPNGSNDITITLATEYQTASIQTLTASVVTINNDGYPSAAVTATITVPAATTSLGGSAGTAAVIVTASVTATYFKDGHNWDGGTTGSFTAPSDPLLPNTKYVRISAISPGGERVWEYDRPAPTGGFVATTVYTFATGPIMTVGTSSQTWTFEFLPVNADNVPVAPKNVTVALQPNAITSVANAEGTHYVEPGGGSKTYLSITPSGTNNTGFSSSAPQTVTAYLSKDNGANFEWKGWPDITAFGVAITSLDTWRPTDANKTCKVALVIGAWDAPQTPTIAAAALPAGAVVAASSFTLNVVGAPIATGVSSASVVTRTASAPYLYNDIVLMKTFAGIPYWGLPDGITWTNPTWATDPDFFYSFLTVEIVDASGNLAPPEQQGKLGTNIDRSDIPGGVALTKNIKWWEFNPAGSIYVWARFKLWNMSRSGQVTQQTTAWAGASFKMVQFGSSPPTSILAAIDPSSVGAGLYIGADSRIKVGTDDNPSNMLENASFSDLTSTGALAVWTNGQSQVGTAARTAFNGASNGLAIAFTGNHTSLVQFFTGGIKPGDRFLLEAYFYFPAGTNGYGRLVLSWADNLPDGFGLVNNGNVGAIEVDCSLAGVGIGQIIPSDTRTKISLIGIAPSNLSPNFRPVSSFRVYIGVNNNSSGTVYMDSPVLKPIIAGTQAQLATSQGVTVTAGGDIATNPGPGLTLNVGGQLVPNQGATVGVNGSGQLVVPSGSLGNAQIINGQLGADLSKFSSSAQPYGFYFGLPSPFDPNVPNLIINTAESPWRTYQKVSGSWIAAQTRPGDLIGGTITATVSLISPTISGGAISGTSYSLTTGGVTIVINSSDYLKISNSATSNIVTVSADNIRIDSAANPNRWASMTLQSFTTQNSSLANGLISPTFLQVSDGAGHSMMLDAFNLRRNGVILPI